MAQAAVRRVIGELPEGEMLQRRVAQHPSRNLPRCSERRGLRATSQPMHSSAVAGRLRRMAQRRAAWPDERGDIELALQVLGGGNDDHSLVDLHRTLSAPGASMAYISREQAALLIEVADK